MSGMDFSRYLLQQLEAHPSMQPQDVVKLCYQAARGGEHLLADTAAAEKYFEREFEAVEVLDGVLYENISDDYARVNLPVWKKRGLPGQWLFRMFCLSAEAVDAAGLRLQEMLAAAGDNIASFPFSREGWEQYLRRYVEAGMPTVHHSEEYRRNERPAYRIVRRDMLRLLPVLELAAKCSHSPCVIAIDGRAGSGKSTLAAWLSAVLTADSVHMDDFFLPLELRQPQRLADPGGNVHYERFGAEVLPGLKAKEGFSYRIFSCSCMDYRGYREIKSEAFRIVEGSYSLHPEFGDYADIAVFSDVEPDVQLSRVIARDGEAAAQMFKSRWIPMEEQYFDTFDIRGRCSVII